jgi:phage shock protein A
VELELQRMKAELAGPAEQRQAIEGGEGQGQAQSQSQAQPQDAPRFDKQ